MSQLLITFLGQCHITGYPGVPPDTVFPEVCRSILQAARPEHQVDLILAPYHHPAELPGAVRVALR
jgi:hypothetical protein